MERRTTIDERGLSRRALLQSLGLVGVVAAAGVTARPAPALAQGPPALGAQESVEEGLKRVFGGRPIKDGAGVVKLDVPLIAENGAVVPVSVEVTSPMTATSYVKHVYVVADRNRIPIVTRVTFTPEAGQASMGENIRLGETGDVRAIAELSDGTVLQVRREVKVTVGGCGG